jgi:N-glycosylase/DNA lyase
VSPASYQRVRTVLKNLSREQLEDYAAAMGMTLATLGQNLGVDKLSVSTNKFTSDEEMTLNSGK